MIHYWKGDLFKVEEGVIAHGCNAQGVMGSGVALGVKNMYPKAYEDYKQYCLLMTPDKILGTNLITEINQNLMICNMITQLNFGRDPSARYVSYDAIDNCFDKLFWLLKDKDVVVHIPKIGAGLGNGNWDVISSIIEHRSGNKDVFCWEL